jgi:hypothetical protein
MQARADKVHRMLDLQQQLHRIEEWTAADLQRRLEELETAQSELIGALNENDALRGLFIDAMARRLRSLAEAAGDTRRATDAQGERVAESAGRLVSVERLAVAADRVVARETAKAELREVIERHVALARQGSGKIGEP